MVFGLVSAVAGFVKVRYLVDKAIIDNVVFRFHYRVTSALFFLFCILCTANSLLGPPIECIYNDKKNEHVINTYCWIMSTFTVRELEGAHLKIGVHVPHRGIGHVEDDDEENKRFHAYYQWVPFVLFLQGLLFYVPHYLWKNWEGGKVRMISDGLRGVLAETRKERLTKQTRLVNYLMESRSLHNIYAIGYFVCEVLNFINVILNIFLTNKFLGGLFLTIGMDAITLPGDDHYNYALAKVFPRVTKCTFKKYGSSGSIETHDSMCVLALNIINEKIYIFLWFWFVFLAIASGLAIVYSLTIALAPMMRKTVMDHRFKFHMPNGLDILASKIGVGDFFLLHLLGQNINTAVFGDVLNELTLELSGPQPRAPPGHMEMTPIYPSKQLMAH